MCISDSCCNNHDIREQSIVHSEYPLYIYTPNIYPLCIYKFSA